MNKKILLAVIVIIAIIGIVGVVALNGEFHFNFALGGDSDFNTNMNDAGAASLESGTLGNELDKSLNDHSKSGLEKNIELSSKIIDEDEKFDTSIKKALDSTDNETIKEYLNLAIKLNQLDLDIQKNTTYILKSEQEYNNKKISAGVYDERFIEYKKNYDKYVKESEKTSKEIKNLLKENIDFIEKLKSFGFTGIFIGEWEEP